MATRGRGDFTSNVEKSEGVAGMCLVFFWSKVGKSASRCDCINCQTMLWLCELCVEAKVRLWKMSDRKCLFLWLRLPDICVVTPVQTHRVILNCFWILHGDVCPSLTTFRKLTNWPAIIGFFVHEVGVIGIAPLYPISWSSPNLLDLTALSEGHQGSSCACRPRKQLMLFNIAFFGRSHWTAGIICGISVGLWGCVGFGSHCLCTFRQIWHCFKVLLIVNLLEQVAGMFQELCS
jgi:hypothetical protein